ncbi:MAG: rane-bound lytic murein transglycosylase, partial [Pseudomonadota bacterium]|nr:rane-bound lytic murein transglycosylase [Pseudomonadota bacterium]
MHKRQWALLLTPLFLLLSACAGLREPGTGAPTAGCPACAPCAKCPGVEPAPPAAKPLQPARWEDVQGWADDNLVAAWPAFQQSCRGLAGKPQWPLWRPACDAAKTVDATDNKAL